MGKITIVGIADGRKDNITIGAFEKVQKANVVFLQTGEVPFADEIEREFLSFDHIYSDASDFEDLKQRISKELIDKAKGGDLVFCALGDISQNQIVSAVIKEARNSDIETEVVYGLPSSCGNIGAAMSDSQKTPSAIKSVSGSSFEVMCESNEGMLIYEIDSSYLASDIKIKLLRLFSGEKNIYVSKGSENPRKISLKDLDRQKTYDYSFSVYIPPSNLGNKKGYTFSDLLDVMQILRSENGCPWDREQTHESLKKFLLEESYEVFDAIESEDMDMLYDELGDVLLQVVFHGQIAKEHREFDSLDITTAICRKMIGRHTHVFGTEAADTSDEVLKNWEKIKEEEKGIESFTHNLKDVPKAMPSLMRSQKVQKRAAACGFDWDDYKLPLLKVHEELRELEQDIEKGKNPEEEMGDLLFAIVNLARHLKIDAEIVLSNGVDKFIKRFEHMEKSAEKKGLDLSAMNLDEMDKLWVESKRQIKNCIVLNKTVNKRV